MKKSYKIRKILKKAKNEKLIKNKKIKRQEE